MPDPSNLATPLAGNANMRAFVQVVREELERIDLTRFLVFLFDTVDESLLDLLAAQYDMLGYNGWILADTVQAKRDLLKGSFALHVLKGTPEGIKEVARRLGFNGVIIEEGWENFSVDLPEPEINPWSHFRVIYSVPPSKAIDPALIVSLRGLIDNYKNARSILADVGLSADQSDSFLMKEELTLNIIPV